MICNNDILLITQLSQKLNTDGTRVISNHYKFFFTTILYIYKKIYSTFKKAEGFLWLNRLLHVENNNNIYVIHLFGSSHHYMLITIHLLLVLRETDSFVFLRISNKEIRRKTKLFPKGPITKCFVT